MGLRFSQEGHIYPVVILNGKSVSYPFLVSFSKTGFAGNSQYYCLNPKLEAFLHPSFMVMLSMMV